MEKIMSELDKIAQQIKVAKEEYAAAIMVNGYLRVELEKSRKAVNDAADVITDLRSKLTVAAEGAEPNYAMWR